MHPSLTLAAVTPDSFQIGHPLFGNQWLALLAAMACIAVLLLAVALLGRWLAATHPDAPAKVVVASIAAAPAPAASIVVIPQIASNPVLAGDVPHELVPVIIAAVAAALGAGARVTSIRPFSDRTLPLPSLEALMQQWSYEGRRQIYSSHKVR
jgi:hypothetical protein